MKKQILLVPLLLLGLTIFGNPRPGLAVASISPDRLDRLAEEGWTEVQPGVMQRTLDNGTVETLGYGEDGLRFRLALRRRIVQNDHAPALSPVMIL